MSDGNLTDYEVIKFGGRTYEQMLAGDTFEFSYLEDQEDSVMRFQARMQAVVTKYGGRQYTYTKIETTTFGFVKVIASPVIPDEDS